MIRHDHSWPNTRVRFRRYMMHVISTSSRGMGEASGIVTFRMHMGIVRCASASGKKKMKLRVKKSLSWTSSSSSLFTAWASSFKRKNFEPFSFSEVLVQVDLRSPISSLLAVSHTRGSRTLIHPYTFPQRPLAPTPPLKVDIFS